MTDRIDALKTLLIRLIDSREGYREAIDNIESTRIKGVLQELLSRRDRNASEVRAYLSREGHSVDDDGSLLASAHRTFLDIKDKLSSSDDAAMLNEVVRGEKYLLDAYDEAISAAGAADPEYHFLVEQHTSLKAAIEQLDTRADLAA